MIKRGPPLAVRRAHRIRLRLTGSADAVDDENERDGVEHPARMTTARRPKVAEVEQVGAADEQARRQPRLLLERVCSDDQGEAADEPVERAELQEQRHEPSDRSGDPPVRELLEWSAVSRCVRTP